MRTIRGWMALASLAFVAACGGGGNAGEPVLGGNNGQPQAADLSMVLRNGAGQVVNTLPNNGIDTIIAEISAVDANRNALPGIPVTVSVDSNAVVTMSGAQTGANGLVTAAVALGTDRSNRVVTVTARSGELVRRASFRVIGAKLTGRLTPAVLSPGQEGKVEFILVDTNTNPMSGEAITLTLPGGVSAAGTTGTNGQFEASYTAPSTAGAVEIRAESGGTSAAATLQVQSGPGTINPADKPVQSASVSVNPSVVAVNTGGTSNRAEVRALFLSDSNSPVPRIRVRFDLDGDKTSVGGTFSSLNNVVYSDASGVATASYLPGERASPPDGVTVRACWDYSDFAEGACPNSVRTTLTVISEPLSVSIGSNALLLVGDSGLDYVKRFVVQVVDSSGQAKPDVQVSAAVDLRRYMKGYWAPGITQWFKVTEAICDNEDLNRNGNAEVYANGQAEDANGSFNFTPGRPALEPRKADVSVSFEGSSRTNASGQVVLRISYPQNVASWVEYNLVVSASGISGSEGRANFAGVLDVLSDEVNDVKTSVPFELSPYGIEPSPVITVTNPDNNQSGQLCTNPR